MNSFPFNTIEFLSKLKKNNNREWFEKNKDEFLEKVFTPAQEFVVVLGELMRSFAPGIIAIPKTDKSIFRLHRDVRFSKDKSPYKTNLGLYCWEGERKKMDCAGFYFHIEPGYMFLGSGQYQFSNELLRKFRNVVYDYEKGKELDSIINKSVKKGFKVGGKTYKKVPRGFDPEYPFSEYLLFSGIYLYEEINDINIFKKEDIVKYAFKKYKTMLPVHRWLVDNI